MENCIFVTVKNVFVTFVGNNTDDELRAVAHYRFYRTKNGSVAPALGIAAFSRR